MRLAAGLTRCHIAVLTCCLLCSSTVSGKGVTLPITRRTGHLHSRELLSNATIPLHGAVRDYGYFYATLQLGSPSRSFEVIVDTGSTITYVPCASCGTDCGSQHADAAFNPATSSTAVPIKCGDAQCECGNPRCSCGPQGECTYIRNYAEHSSSAGQLMQDEMQLLAGGFPVVFGCETRETGEIYSQEADGIMGLGNSAVSVMNQLAGANHIEDVFSLCFGGVEGDGALMLGDVPPASFNVTLQYTPLLSSPAHPHYYLAKLNDVSVNGTTLPVGQGLYDIGYGTVLDSGTTFSYLPTAAFDQFQQSVSAFALGHGLHSTPGPDPKFRDICFGGAPAFDKPQELATVFPTMELHFEGTLLVVPPLNYLFMHTREANAYCIGMFNNGGSGTLLGGITFRDILIQLGHKRWSPVQNRHIFDASMSLQYDRRNRRVGFGTAPCQGIGSGQLVLDPCDSSLIPEARAMLPTCGAHSSPVATTTLVEPSTSTKFRPGKEDDLLDSEVATNSPSTLTAAAATFRSRGAAVTAGSVGGVMVVACAIGLIITQTDAIARAKRVLQRQSYEAIIPEQRAVSTVSLSEIAIEGPNSSPRGSRSSPTASGSSPMGSRSSPISSRSPGGSRFV